MKGIYDMLHNINVPCDASSETSSSSKRTSEAITVGKPRDMITISATDKTIQLNKP